MNGYRSLVTAFGAVLLVAMIAVFYRSLDADRVNRTDREVHLLLDRTRTLEARLDDSIALASHDALNDYDRSYRLLRALRDNVLAMTGERLGLYRSGVPAFDFYIDRMITGVNIKEELVNRYLSSTARLRVSLNFYAAMADPQNPLFPDALDYQDPVVRDQLARLQGAVALYTGNRVAATATVVRDALAPLRDRARNARLFKRLVRHAEIILETTPVVDTLGREIIDTRLTDTLELLEDTYLGHHSELERDAVVYRYVLWAATALMFLFLIALALRLQRLSGEGRRRTRVIESSLDAVTDGVIVTDADNRIVYMNPAARSRCGVDHGSAHGLAVDAVLRLVSPVTGEAPRLAIEPDREVPGPFRLNNLQPRAVAAETAPAARERSLIEVAVTPMADDRARYSGSVVVVRDQHPASRDGSVIRTSQTHDDLTGLLNREGFLEVLTERGSRMRGSGDDWALVCVSLENFSVINSAAGFAAGDQLLCRVAALAARNLAADEFAGRIGGDVFALVLRDRGTPALLERALALQNAINELGFERDNVQFDTFASLGITHLVDSSDDIEELLRGTEDALYSQSASCFNGVHIFDANDPGLRARAEMIRIAPRVRKALADDRLELHLQPVFATSDTTRPCQFEVLLRMIDEQGERVLPGHFLPAARRYNLMPRLDIWVIRETLKRVAEGDTGDASFGINLSGESVGNTAFVTEVLQLLRDADWARDRVTFEITESTVIENLDVAAQFVGSLRRLGHRFALDDVGHDLSSLAYVSRMEMDTLKIDGHFIRDVADDPVNLAIVRAIAEAARDLGIRVIAECVETEGELACLARLDIPMIQGFLTGRPRPWSDFFGAPGAAGS